MLIVDRHTVHCTAPQSRTLVSNCPLVNVNVKLKWSNCGQGSLESSLLCLRKDIPASPSQHLCRSRKTGLRYNSIHQQNKNTIISLLVHHRVHRHRIRDVEENSRGHHEGWRQQGTDYGGEVDCSEVVLVDSNPYCDSWKLSSQINTSCRRESNMSLSLFANHSFSLRCVFATSVMF